MLMMVMMMKKKAARALAAAAVALLLVSTADGLLTPTDRDLNEMSQLGEKYLDKQIENAISGVKEMKSLMDQSSDEHKTFLSSLEETKLKKEEALRAAQEMQAKLEQEEEVCNESMRSLWEECKPCLKNTCVKFYSRTCSSGAGLVGRQLDRVLNRTSPFSIWVNGENVDVLEKEGERQNRHFQNLEDRYSRVEDGVDGIFYDSMKVFDHMRSLDSPFFRMPSLWGPQPHRSRAGPQDGAIRVARSPLQGPDFHGFQSMFFPMMESARDVINHMGATGDGDDAMEGPTSEDGSVNEDVVITKPFGNGQMTCREIRRNSAGCLKLREECQKCKDIRNLDCSGERPLEGPLKAELEEALAAAERFTQRYSTLMRGFEEHMFNTSAILDFLNQQFSWVSTLANRTKDTKEPIFSVQGVISKEKQEKVGGEAEEPAQTEVSVHLFDAPPMTLTVPGEIPWSDPKFTEVVAQKALEHYKESAVVVK